MPCYKGLFGVLVQGSDPTPSSALYEVIRSVDVEALLLIPLCRALACLKLSEREIAAVASICLLALTQDLRVSPQSGDHLEPQLSSARVSCILHLRTAGSCISQELPKAAGQPSW